MKHTHYLPPQATELESVVLGAILSESKAIFDVVDVLSAGCFYKETHQLIYQAVLDLHNGNKAIDVLTVAEQLKSKGQLDQAGGPFYLANLTSSVGSSAHIKEHAMIVYEKYMHRQVIDVSSEINKLAHEDETDVFDLISKAQNMMDDINASISNSEPFSDTVLTTAIELATAQQNSTKTGVMTFLPKFDEHAGGLQPGELIIIAGRPGMGKSAVMCDWAFKQAENGIPVGIFSLEMSKRQLIHRFISMRTEIPYEKMRTGGLNEQEIKAINRAALDISEMPIFIHDEGGIGIGKMLGISKMWKHKYGIKALYTDYIQLVTAFDAGKKFGNREQELAFISGKLKTLSKTLDIPVMALAQLSRAVESRADKRPMLADLRESGALEQDADMVIFPFRPSHYQLKDETGADFSDLYAELIIAKFRAGRVKDLQCEFEVPFSRFVRTKNTIYDNPSTPF